MMMCWYIPALLDRGLAPGRITLCQLLESGLVMVETDKGHGLSVLEVRHVYMLKDKPN